VNRPHFAVTALLALAVVVLLLRPFGGPDCAAVAVPGLGDSACCLSDGTCLDSDFETCETLGGSFVDHGIVCSQVACEATCGGDLNDDSAVNTLDLLVLLANWGDCR
jgi:hypothetical protein